MMDYAKFDITASHVARSESIDSQEMKEFAAIYEILDRGNTGAIPVDDLAVYLGNLGYLAEAEARTFLTMMDADGNGKISLSEFLEAMKGHYIQLPEIANTD